MTSILAQPGEDSLYLSSSVSASNRMQESSVEAIAGDVITDIEKEPSKEVLVDIQSCSSIIVTPTRQNATLELDSDGVSDEGTYPSASFVSTSSVSASTESDPGEWTYAKDFGPCRRPILGLDTVYDIEKRNNAVEVIESCTHTADLGRCLCNKKGTSCRLHEEMRNCGSHARDSDGGGGQFLGIDNPRLADACGGRPCPGIFPDPIAETSEDAAHIKVTVGHCQNDLCSVTSIIVDELLGSTVNVVSLAYGRVAPLRDDLSAACGSDELGSTVQVVTDINQIVPEGSLSSSSLASIMHSDDGNVKECQKGRCEVVFRDLEAGLPIDSTSAVDEEGMLCVDLLEDCKASSLVEATNEAVSVEAYDHHAASCDAKALVDSALIEPLLSHVQTDDTKSSQDKEVSLSGENKLGGGDSLENEAEVHGLRKRRGAKVDAIKPSIGGDFGVGKMPDEEKRGGLTATRPKDASADIGQEAKQKSGDKKTGKQGKGTGKPAVVKRVCDPPPLEELRAKEEAETNRKVHESLDNFIRQTIRCEPYMNFTGSPVNKPRMRPEAYDNHVAGKFARGFKLDSDPREVGAEENLGVDSHTNDVDGLKDASNSSTKGSAGLGRGSQHSLKVPPGVVAFTQAAAKGTDLQGWLSPSKISTSKCEKCAREFCSTLNYRRHVRVHRRPMNPEKEDLSKERSKVAAFWDKLTPEEASSIVHYANMETEDISGPSALKALTVLVQQSGLPSLPQGILKAGTSLLDIAQNKSSAFPLSSERLLSILDDASEKTFLCGGTSLAAQRFVFNGDAGKVGLEEKNVVASIGFQIELKLLKAWMADKEAEALRCEQALVKEEEAAQQKKAKLMVKRRNKKIRIRERKGGASQLILQELENESIDDEGNIQGTGEEDDSPTATGSSSSSLASAQDLALPESAELDITEDFAQIDTRDEPLLVLEDDQDMEKNLSPDEDQLHRSQDGWERSQITSHQVASESSDKKEEPSTKESVMEDRRGVSIARSAVKEPWEGDTDARLAHPFPQTRTGKTGELQSSLYFRKGEQERVGSDIKRREFDRCTLERKPLRITRDRSRNDLSESVQKPGRDSRSFDGRYGDGPQTFFKPVRKANPDYANVSRGQQYRSKPSGMNRTMPTSGQVVWTRKVPQPAAVDATKDIKEEEVIQDDAASTKVSTADGWETSEASPDVALCVSDFAGGDVATKLDKEGMEKKEDAATADSLEVSTGNVITLSTSSSTSVSFHVDSHSEDWPRLPQRSGSNHRCHTPLLTKSASFDSGASIPLEDHVESVSQLSEGDPGNVVGPCSDGSFGLMKTNLLSVRLQDNRLAGSGDDGNSAKEISEADEEGLSGNLLVGSLSVPLFNFVRVNVSQTKSGSHTLHPGQPDISEVANHSEAGNLDQTDGMQSPLKEMAPGDTDGSDPRGEGLGSPLRASGASAHALATQSVKLKPHYSLSSPERGDNSRHSPAPLGHERLASKSWQTSTGRCVSVKVWRAVGMVGDRHDSSTPGLHAAGGDSAPSFIDGRPLQEDVDVSGRSESELEISPKADVREPSPTYEDRFSKDDLHGRDGLNDDQNVAVHSNIGVNCDNQPFPSASDPARSLGTESEPSLDGGANSLNKALSDYGVEATVLASGLCSLSIFVEVAGTFFNERWRVALAHASVDEVLVLATESVPKEAEDIDFLDMVLIRLSNQKTGHHPGAESLLPSPSSVVIESLGNPAQDGRVLLSRIFSDADQTGMEDVRFPSTPDEQGLDGAGAENTQEPQALSSEDDAGMREASSSPGDSENSMSGSETSRNIAPSSVPLGTGEKWSESRGGGSVGSTHVKRGSSRQEKWYRNPRDRFPEQRYMPRGRAPVEKTC